MSKSKNTRKNASKKKRPSLSVRMVSISNDDPRMVAFRARNGAPFDFEAMLEKAYQKAPQGGVS